MRDTAVVLASGFLAVTGASAVEPGRAEATSTVKSCTGDDIRIRAAEKQMLVLHYMGRASRDLPRLCVHTKLPSAVTRPTRAR